MSPASILRLQDYRERREQRRESALALLRPDPARTVLAEQLWRACGILGADRGAVLWVDEYGPGLVHVHCLLDLASDRPRRHFPPEPLRRAWGMGVPGLHDEPDVPAEAPREAPRSRCSLSLGSDGTRAWFLALDSVTPRAPLTRALTGLLMFLAGRCVSVVLHRDLEDPQSTGSGPPFSGWAVLQDVQGREEDEEANRRIAARFLVARAVQSLVEEDLAIDPETLRYQVEGVRAEIEGLPADDRERMRWAAILEAIAAGRYSDLPQAVLDLGGEVERQGHHQGAVELYDAAYRLATATGEVPAAIDAARFRGRVLRRTARWGEAIGSYELASSIAQTVGDVGRYALALVGLGGLYRDRGNLPRARETLLRSLEAAETADDRYARASAHHDLATVEKLCGQHEAAMRHAWRSLAYYDDEQGRLKAMADLGGILVEAGELDAAEDAYTIVAERVEKLHYQVYALFGLAYVSALRGRREEFERRLVRADGIGSAGATGDPELMLYRGLGYRSLGASDEAKVWLERALSAGEREGVNRTVLLAEAALADLDRAEEMTRIPRSPQARPETALEIESGLRELRERLVGAGA